MFKRLYPITLTVCFLTALPGTLAAQTPLPNQDSLPSTESPFAKSNLHVWAFEEYDAVERTAVERARLLKELGLTKAGYICRNPQRAAEFEEYLTAYKRAGIELIAVWTPVHTGTPLKEPQIKVFLDVVDRHKLRVQWWLTLEEDFDALAENIRIDHAVSRLRPLVIEANNRKCRLVVYGHGTTRWFTQCENQIAIVEKLQTTMPKASLGIVYNFHQSHAQMARFNSVFPRLSPHLVALNLNGMHSDGPRIETIGKGDGERDMIETVFKSRWQGPVGILHHQRTKDAGKTLRANLDGLQSVLKELGDVSALSTN
ncbi:MAG TPA: hypothetical protein DDW52_04365 [Planctomycetaceae bacterium]|nr:hypothetical protein [Planctomycetaceae bacterium]